MLIRFITSFALLSRLPWRLALFFFLLAPGAAFSGEGVDLNALVLAQVKAMPRGGGYATSAEASGRLARATAYEPGKEGIALRLAVKEATPSYCSGATYLVFLKTLDALHRQGRLPLDEAGARALLVRGQPDGAGIWGRWNANGPGTARLFHELGLGRSFDDFEKARPGDFMKIFWTREVGSRERGHSVVYLGRETRDGVEQVRFWSSNRPGGYGEKTVPRWKIAYAIFSRLEHPENLGRRERLPARDPYLSSLLSVRSSVEEARARSGF